MHDEVEERMREEREAAKRAECFARLVLAEHEDHAGRRLLDYAERIVDRRLKRASCATSTSTTPSQAGASRRSAGG